MVLHESTYIFRRLRSPASSRALAQSCERAGQKHDAGHATHLGRIAAVPHPHCSMLRTVTRRPVNLGILHDTSQGCWLRSFTLYQRNTIAPQ